MILNQTPTKIFPYKTKWSAPSNIALVKYWGKKGHQLPANPSVSLTLKNCLTFTEVEFTPSDTLEVDLYLGDEKNEKFAEKIKKFILSLNCNWLNHLRYTVRTQNTFPHGTGIASSASGMSAFCLCLVDFYYELQQLERDADFFKNASFYARLASGSASRSLFGGVVVWGENRELDTSDEWAKKIQTHSLFETMLDSVLIVSSEEKAVSSTAGHSKMSDHYFKEARYSQARDHFEKMIVALKVGDLETFGEVLESEALSLHAMMLTSPENYILLKPETLSIIECVRDFRRQTKIPVYFTLDAGPNVHLIYPASYLEKVRTFIQTELSPSLEHVIHDEVGSGPQKC